MISRIEGKQIRTTVAADRQRIHGIGQGSDSRGQSEREVPAALRNDDLAGCTDYFLPCVMRAGVTVSRVANIEDVTGGNSGNLGPQDAKLGDQIVNCRD